MTIAIRMVLAAFVLFPLSVPMARTSYPADPALANKALTTIYPYRGTYYDPQKGGTGIQVDVGAGGAAFVTYYSYTATGAATFYVLQDVYHASDELTRWNEDVIGTMRGTFYSAQGGECLGCPYAPPSPVFTEYAANLSWVNSREVRMQIGTQTWNFIAPDLDNHPDGDYLIGNWVVHRLGLHNAANKAGYGAKTLHDDFATVRIAYSSKRVSLAANAPAGLTNYSAAARVFDWSCNELADPNFAPPPLCRDTLEILTRATGGTFVFWYDPSTNRLGADVAVPQGGGTYQIGPVNTHVDLYLQTPDLIVGRGITEGAATGTNAYYNPGSDTLYGLSDGALNIELYLQRIPDDSRGGNSPRTY